MATGSTALENSSNASKLYDVSTYGGVELGFFRVIVVPAGSALIVPLVILQDLVSISAVQAGFSAGCL